MAAESVKEKRQENADGITYQNMFWLFMLGNVAGVLRACGVLYGFTVGNRTWLRFGVRFV